MNDNQCLIVRSILIINQYVRRTATCYYNIEFFLDTENENKMIFFRKCIVREQIIFINK